LYEASRTGDVEAVKKLLARNVDVNYAGEVRGRVWAGGRRGRQWNRAKRHGMEVTAAL
jgi:hypothetical protein